MTQSTPSSGAQILSLRRGDHEEAARVAIKWLGDRHRKGWRSAFGALLDQLCPEGREEVSQLDDDVGQMLVINAGEWLLARGEMFVKGEMRSINEHLLGRDGPYFTPGQQRWIAQLRERWLRLYRVTEVRVGEGLTLVDELDASIAPQAGFVQDGMPGRLPHTSIMSSG
jgi:hypothetical protein